MHTDTSLQNNGKSSFKMLNLGVTFYQMIIWDSASIGALISQPHPPFSSVFCDAGPGAANSVSVLSAAPSWELLPRSTGSKAAG